MVAPFRTEKGQEEEDTHLEVLRTKNKNGEVMDQGLAWPGRGPLSDLGSQPGFSEPVSMPLY